MSEIYIEVQNYDGSSGLNLSAPSSDTNVADHMKALIEDNGGLTEDNVSDLLISIPIIADGFNLTSMGKIDLNDDTSLDSTLWRMRNGESDNTFFDLEAYKSTFSERYRGIRANHDTYVISPIFEEPATHILDNIDTGEQKVKASSNEIATGYDLSNTTDNYSISGTVFQDTLTGAGGDDTLSGGLEGDDLTGGLGSDELYLGANDNKVDSVFYDPTTIADAGTASDTINEFEVGTDKIVLGGVLDLASNSGTVTYMNFGPFAIISNSGSAFAIVQGVTLTDSDFLIP